MLTKYSRVVFSVGVVLAVFNVASCNPALPKNLPSEHAKYNDALDDAMNTEILTNIVREYYSESPAYLTISSISTSQSPSSYSAELDPSVLTGGISNIWDNTSGSFSASIGNVSSTIAYTPNTGSDYSQRLLRPLPLKFLAAIGYSESSVRDIFRIAVGRIGPWDNAYPWPNRMGHEKMERNARKNLAFMDLLQDVFSMNGHVLRVESYDMQAKKESDSVSKDTEGAKQYVIKIPVEKGFKFTSKEKALLKEIGLGTNINEIVLSPRPLAGAVTFIPRTVIGIHKSLSLLIHGVPYPPETDALRRLGGDHFFAIFSSASKPSDAYVKTFVHDKWFYIKESDKETKVSFETLELLYDVTRIVPASGVSYLVK